MTEPLLTLPYLHSALKAGDVYAVVTQGASGHVTIAAEIGPGPGDAVITPLVGGEGAAGTQQFPLRLQLDVLDAPALLPTDLTKTNADIGKFWLIDQVVDDVVISSAAYIWFGAEFRVLPFGTQGIEGPYGVLVPYTTLIGPDETSQINVPDTGVGTATNPYLMTFELSVPTGPSGPSAPLATFTDVGIAVPPTVGQFLGYNGETVDSLPVWEPLSVGDIIPKPYVVPQSAFSSYANITFESTVTVATFAVPPNSFGWKPLVWGQIEMTLDWQFSLSPLIGVEVMLGHPTAAGGGTLVARGFGNASDGVVTIMPHTSDPSHPTVAMTPSNSTGLVPPNHTGAQGTLYVNLVNDGLFAIFDFQPPAAQLFVLACPAIALTPTPVCGALTTKLRLSAKTITQGS